MVLKDMKLEELELMSYTDLTYKILKEEKKPLNTPTIFHHICDLLGYSDQDFEDKIGDYYTSLTIDKRFIMLDSGEWDLRENHSVELNLEDEIVDEEEIEEETEESSEEDEEDKDEMDVEDESLDSTLEDDLEDSDDDMDDLSILDEDDLEAE